MASLRLGVDIGGTFTDFCLLEEETGQIQVLKISSRPDRPEQAVFDGIARLFADHEVQPADIGYFIHGTTLAVNTVIQRSGTRTALLVTQGFRDILNIGRHRLPDIFNFFTEMPKALVPRSLVFEIPERCSAEGEVLRPIDEAAVRQAVATMVAKGAEAVAICFLHSYRNSRHEIAARSLIEQAEPELYVSVSSDIWPQMREYERALVTVMNAYIGKTMQVYFTNLKTGVRGRGISAPILSTKSNGGVMHAQEAAVRPVETLLSGPAAGVIGASIVGEATGFRNLVSFDMGGTSADVAVVEGEPRYSTENQVGDFPVIMPAVDVTSIGAGGGSIAWTDSNGVLKVGPKSAGSTPGPACYDLGGTHATVTDAYVCLGMIDPARFLGGAVEINPARAAQAVERVSRTLGLDTRETAESILRVVTSKMYAALVPLLARKGINYEDFTLLAFGGAGPTHGFLLAREVGIQRIIVPLHPGVLCALGSLAADVRRDFVRTIHQPLGANSETSVLGQMREALQTLTRDGHQWLEGQGLQFLSSRVQWSADMRYLGQSFELTVRLDEHSLADKVGKTLREAFHRHYEQVYGFTDEVADLEILNVRATAVGVTPKPKLERVATRQKAREALAGPGQREIYFDGQVWNAVVYDRRNLVSETRFQGPAIVEQYDTTVFVPADFVAMVDQFGNLIGEARDDL